MEAKKLNYCKKIAKEIFNKILEDAELKKIKDDFRNKYPYQTACCYVDISYEKSGVLFLDRNRTDKISDNNKYYQCYECSRKGTIIDWCRKFFNLSLLETINFIGDYFELDLYNIRDLDNYNKTLVLIEINKFNQEYIDNECEDINEEMGRNKKDIFTDEDPFTDI